VKVVIHDAKKLQPLSEA